VFLFHTLCKVNAIMTPAINYFGIHSVWNTSRKIRQIDYEIYHMVLAHNILDMQALFMLSIANWLNWDHLYKNWNRKRNRDVYSDLPIYFIVDCVQELFLFAF
jgi:hypothetical protein